MLEKILIVLGCIVVSYILTVVIVDVINQYLYLNEKEDDEEDF